MGDGVLPYEEWIPVTAIGCSSRDEPFEDSAVDAHVSRIVVAEIFDVGEALMQASLG